MMFSIIERRPGWYQAQYRSVEHETWAESECPWHALYRVARAIRSRVGKRRRPR